MKKDIKLQKDLKTREGLKIILPYHLTDEELLKEIFVSFLAKEMKAMYEKDVDVLKVKNNSWEEIVFNNKEDYIFNKALRKAYFAIIQGYTDLGFCDNDEARKLFLEMHDESYNTDKALVPLKKSFWKDSFYLFPKHTTPITVYFKAKDYELTTEYNKNLKKFHKKLFSVRNVFFPKYKEETFVDDRIEILNNTYLSFSKDSFTVISFKKLKETFQNLNKKEKLSLIKNSKKFITFSLPLLERSFILFKDVYKKQFSYNLARGFINNKSNDYNYYDNPHLSSLLAFISKANIIKRAFNKKRDFVLFMKAKNYNGIKAKFITHSNILAEDNYKRLPYDSFMYLSFDDTKRNNEYMDFLYQKEKEYLKQNMKEYIKTLEFFKEEFIRFLGEYWSLKNFVKSIDKSYLLMLNPKADEYIKNIIKILPIFIDELNKVLKENYFSYTIALLNYDRFHYKPSLSDTFNIYWGGFSSGMSDIISHYLRNDNIDKKSFLKMNELFLTPANEVLKKVKNNIWKDFYTLLKKKDQMATAFVEDFWVFWDFVDDILLSPYSSIKSMVSFDIYQLEEMKESFYDFLVYFNEYNRIEKWSRKKEKYYLFDKKDIKEKEYRTQIAKNQSLLINDEVTDRFFEISVYYNKWNKDILIPLKELLEEKVKGLFLAFQGEENNNINIDLEIDVSYITDSF